MQQAVRTSRDTMLLHCAAGTQGFSGVFAVPTPVTDASGVAHVVEHLVFRSSPLYPEAHNLFAALALLPLKINATTLAGITYYFIETEHEALFYQALVYVYAGLVTPAYTSDDILREKDGVIFQELLFRENQPGYETYLASLIAEGRGEEAVAGGFSGGLAALSATEVNHYKRLWYTPDNITLLFSQGDTEHISTLLDITAAQVAPEQKSGGTHSLSQTGRNFPSGLPLRPEQQKMQSAALTSLIDNYIAFSTTSKDTQNTCEALAIKVPSEHLKSRREPLFPPITRNNTASFVFEAKASGRFTLNALPPLPKYVIDCWDQFHFFLPVSNQSNDWYYAFPQSEKIFPQLEALLLREHFWSPRISGDCYSQGVGLHGNTVVIYLINDARAGDRKGFCEQIRTQLFDA